jgi:V8-like Glu-specific endopeptidase
VEYLEDRLTPSLSPVGNVTEFPYRAIVELQITWPNHHTGSGTGAMVDSYHVLTAAHCIFDAAEGGWAQQIIVTPAMSGNSAPYGQAVAIYGHVTDNWIQHSEAGTINSYTDSDVGLLTLNCFLGNTTGWFQLLPTPDGQYSYNMSVSMAGYPGLNGNQISFQNPASLGDIMYGEPGTITTVSPDSNGEEFTYPFQDLQYTFGMSGAPLWVNNNGVPSIVGIHVTGGVYPGTETVDPNGSGTATRISNFINLWVQNMELVDDAFLLPRVAPGPSSASISANATNDALSGVSAMTSAGPAPSNPYLETEESPWATTTTLSVTASSVQVGQPVQFTAVVASAVPVANSASAIIPTGTVTFYDGTMSLGTVNLVANASGAASATLTTTVLLAGNDTITAVYSGDSKDLGSRSAVVTETVAGLALGSLSTRKWPENEPGYAGTISVSNGTGQLTSLQVTGLPAGLVASLSDNTIVLGGTPTQAGTFGNIVVSLQNTTGASASATYTLVIEPPPSPTILVTTTSDAVGHSGESLRDAVAQADNDAAQGRSDSIGFAADLAGQTITLTQGKLELKGTGAITIDGGGQITVSGNNASLVFAVHSGAQVLLSGLTVSSGGITNGSAFTEVGGNLSLDNCTITGGGIYSNGTLTVTNCLITGNTSPNAGGIWNDGTATLTDCTITGNTAQFNGGGIANLGDMASAHLTLTNCTVSGNSAGSGGGIDNGGFATLTGCTISGNSAGNGGGIDDSGLLTLIDTTVSQNSATNPSKGGAGISIIDDYATVTIIDSTIAGNAAVYKGGGIYNGYPNALTGTPSVLTLQNTIVAGNYAASAPDVDTNPTSGATVTATYSMVGNTTGSGIAGGTGNILNPMSLGLGGLGNYGGPTQTMALLAGSPAVGAGAIVNGITSDQRGVSRPVVAPDIGAYQTQQVPVPTQLVVTSNPLTLTAGIPGGPITVLLEDQYGNNIQAGSGGLTVNLSSSSSKGIFLDGNGNPLSSPTITIPQGSSTARFVYEDNQAGMPVLTVKGAGVSAATQQEQVNAALPSAMEFTTGAQTLIAGNPSGSFNVQLLDRFGNVAPAGVGGVTIYLSTTSSASKFLDTTGQPLPQNPAPLPSPSLSILQGGTSASFEYQDALTGAPTIIASAWGLTPAVQQETVNPVNITFPVHVLNVPSSASYPPLLTAGSALSGKVATFTVTDTKAVASSFSATISWGDGMTSVVGPYGGNGTFTVTGSHTYLQEGRYQLSVRVTETNGSTGAGFAVAHVARVGGAPSGLGTAASTFTHGAEYYGDFIIANFQKYLGRNPAPAEVAAWVTQMQNGMTDETAEAFFIASPEFEHDYGGIGAGWITGIYELLLNRAPALAEVNGWLQAMENGESPTAVAFAFTDSTERETDRIITDYQKYLGRNPAQSEVKGWVNAFESGLTNEDLVTLFVGGAPGSREYFQTHYDNIDDWLYTAYQDILGRPPDAAGLQGWLAVLATS